MSFDSDGSGNGSGAISAGLKKIGEILMDRALVTSSDIAKALAFQEQFGGRLGAILVRLGALSEDALLPALSDQLSIPVLDSSEWPASSEAIRQLLVSTPYSTSWWVENEVAAWRLGDDQQARILVAGIDPLNPSVNEALERVFSGQVWEWRLVQSQPHSRLLDMVRSSAVTYTHLTLPTITAV